MPPRPISRHLSRSHGQRRHSGTWPVLPIIGAVAHGIAHSLAPPYYHDNHEYHQHDYHNGLHNYRWCRRCYQHSMYCARCKRRGYYAHVYSEVDNFMLIGDLMSTGLAKIITETTFGTAAGKIGTDKSNMGLAYPFGKYESNLVKIAGNDIINSNTKFSVSVVVTAFTDTKGDAKTNNHWVLYHATSNNVSVDTTGNPVYYESRWSDNDDIMGVQLNLAMANPKIVVDTMRKDKIVALHVRTTVREMIPWVKLDASKTTPENTFLVVNYPHPTQVVVVDAEPVPSAVAFDSNSNSSVVRVYADHPQYSIETANMTGRGYIYNRPKVSDASIAEDVREAINQVDAKLINNDSYNPVSIETTIARLPDDKKTKIEPNAKAVKEFVTKYTAFKSGLVGKFLIVPTTNYTFDPDSRTVSNPEVFLLFAPALKKGQDNGWASAWF